MFLIWFSWFKFIMIYSSVGLPHSFQSVWNDYLNLEIFGIFCSVMFEDAWASPSNSSVGATQADHSWGGYVVFFVIVKQSLEAVVA